jgi:hypothetical protein
VDSDEVAKVDQAKRVVVCECVLAEEDLDAARAIEEVDEGRLAHIPFGDDAADCIDFDADDLVGSFRELFHQSRDFFGAVRASRA